MNIAIYTRLSKETTLEKVDIDPEVERTRPGGRGLFRGPKIEKAFFSVTESPTSLRNQGSIYSSGDYDYPTFGWQWGIYRGYIVTMVDIHPLRSDLEYRQRYVEPIKSIREKYSIFHKYEMPRPPWSEPFHSGYEYIGRIPPENIGDSINLVVDYFSLWLGFWREAEPQKDPKLMEAASKRKREMREAYRKNEPGKELLIRAHGKELAEKIMELSI